jgi:transmembrane sensor
VSLSVTRKAPQDLADEFAWRRGILAFRKTKLADVIAEFNRYNATRLVIADPSIAGVAITADLKADRYDDFLQLAQTMLKLRVSRQGNDILISGDQREETKKTVRRKHGP